MSASVYLGRQQIFMNLKNGAHIVEHVVHLFRRNFAGHLTKLFLFLFRFRGFSSVGKSDAAERMPDHICSNERPVGRGQSQKLIPTLKSKEHEDEGGQRPLKQRD